MVLLSDLQIKLEARVKGTAENEAELVERLSPATRHVSPTMDRENRFSGSIWL